MSGHTAEIVANHDVLNEGVRLVSKPFPANDLAATVRKALNHAWPNADAANGQEHLGRAC